MVWPVQTIDKQDSGVGGKLTLIFTVNVVDGVDDTSFHVQGLKHDVTQAFIGLTAGIQRQEVICDHSGC